MTLLSVEKAIHGLFTWAPPENAEGFRGCESPPPAAADVFHSLLACSVEHPGEHGMITLCNLIPPILGNRRLRLSNLTDDFLLVDEPLENSSGNISGIKGIKKLGMGPKETHLITECRDV